MFVADVESDVGATRQVATLGGTNLIYVIGEDMTVQFNDTTERYDPPTSELFFSCFDASTRCWSILPSPKQPPGAFDIACVGGSVRGIRILSNGSDPYRWFPCGWDEVVEAWEEAQER